MSLSLPIPKGILRAELFGKSASDRVKQHGKTVKLAYGGACKRKGVNFILVVVGASLTAAIS